MPEPNTEPNTGPQPKPEPSAGPSRLPAAKLRADARRNREKVLRAARETFAESGYDVPLDEIAARAGVGAGTVYRHFPSKEALFEAVTRARVEDLIADAQQRAAAAEPGPAFFGFLVRLADEAAAKRDLPQAIAVPGTVQDEMRSSLGLLLRNAQNAGAVRPGVTATDLVVLLKGMLVSLQQDPDPGLRDRIVAIITDGLRPPA
jgi:AcrR family transcriptional regulator